jgi:hypothetical protein
MGQPSAQVTPQIVQVGFIISKLVLNYESSVGIVRLRTKGHRVCLFVCLFVCSVRPIHLLKNKKYNGLDFSMSKKLVSQIKL